MNKITLIRNIGFAKKSVANWSYHVHIIIDDTGARYYKETFGGEERMIRKMEERGRESKEVIPIEVLSVGGCKEPAKFGVRNVETMKDIEEYEGVNYNQK